MGVRLEVLVKGILLGNTAGWGAPEFAFYHRTLGRAQRVGWEIECNQLPQEVLTLPSFSDYSHQVGVLNKSWVMHTFDKCELTYLSNCSQPDIWFKHTEVLVKSLSSIGLTGVGGVHVNVQQKSFDDEKRPFITGAPHSIGGSGYRMEFKCGKSFIQTPELRMGTFLLVYAERQRARARSERNMPYHDQLRHRGMMWDKAVNLGKIADQLSRKLGLFTITGYERYIRSCL